MINGCEFCKHVEIGDFIKPLFDEYQDIYNLYAFISQGISTLSVHTSLNDDEVISKDVSINFCPMCGRQLNKDYKIISGN